MTNLLVLLLLLTANALQSTGYQPPSSLVGVWTAPIVNTTLPNTQLPHVPLLGNGYFGAAFGGGEQNQPITAYLNSNGMWACQPAPSGSLVPALCYRVALGGVSIATELDGQFSQFRAEQHIGSGLVRIVRSSNATSDMFIVEATMHPHADVLMLNLTWTGSQQLAVNVTTFARGGSYAAAAGCTSTSTARAMESSPFLPSVTCAPTTIATASRNLANSTVVIRPHSSGSSSNSSQIRQLWAALATRVSLRMSSTELGQQQASVGHQAHEQIRLDSTADAAATHQLYLTPPTQAQALLVTALADTLGHAINSSTDPTPAAAALAANTDPTTILSAAQSYWSSLHNVSGISLPGAADVEAFWWGALYITATMSPSTSTLQRRPLAPASGLYGPWVTVDGPGWNGDYTLDYNYEAQFYGLYSANHVDLAAAYYAPVLDWMPAAALGAQQAAAQAKINCTANKTLHYSCHLAPWGYQSRDQTIYMHWNGFFAALNFIKHWEYTRNVSFARSFTYPLLDGLNSWSHCYLQNVSTGPGPGQYVYNDYRPAYPDQEHEQQPVPNPQIGLALLRRVAEAQQDMASALRITPPDYVADIIAHLAAFNVHAVPAPPGPAPPGAFSVKNNTRCTNDYHMESVDTVEDCENGCYADGPACAAFTFCATGEKGQPAGFCPSQNTCWRYHSAENCAGGNLGFTSGIRSSSDLAGSLLHAATTNSTVWTAYANATVDDSDNFSLYPLWPSEVIDPADNRSVPPNVAAIARATSRTYSKLSQDRPVLVLSAAVRAGSGSGFGWTAAEVLQGIQVRLKLIRDDFFLFACRLAPRL